VYIERRLTPLNLFLASADDVARGHAIRDYGYALKELAAVNIFPGDLLFKNFGVTRYGRVVFYDYDEIEYLTDCRFRAIPERPAGIDELSDEVWYPVGSHDVFPEEFATFLLTDLSIRRAFTEYHADLLDPRWWQAMQEANRGGRQTEVLSYADNVRFRSAAATPPSRAILQ
jgi:isocitrate dehydrogenase kinase/phosphatase